MRRSRRPKKILSKCFDFESQIVPVVSVCVDARVLGRQAWGGS